MPSGDPRPRSTLLEAACDEPPDTACRSTGFGGRPEEPPRLRRGRARWRREPGHRRCHRDRHARAGPRVGGNGVGLRAVRPLTQRTGLESTQRRNRELHHRGGPGIASGSGWGRCGLLVRPVPPGAAIVRAGGVREMSLIGMSSFDGVACPRDPAALLAGAQDGDPVVGTPDAPDTVVYLLVYSAPEGPAEGDAGGGWTLLARHDTGWGWTRSLAAHGAGVHAAARVAKAVAVRVLSGQGVAVESWADDQPAHPAVFRARLLSAPTAARSAHAPRCVVFRKLQKGLPPRGSREVDKRDPIEDDRGQICPAGRPATRDRARGGR